MKSGTLPDTVFLDGGWTFYANNLPVKLQPEVLPDTTMEGIKYKVIKFPRLKHGPANSYVIGCLRCDGRGKLFSFEKQFSSEVNCTMTRFCEFKKGASRPFASRGLQFLSDTLSEKELKAFSAWEKNQQSNPVHQ